MRYYIAIDIGGTHIKYGIVAEDGHIYAMDSCETHVAFGIAALKQTVVDVVASLQDEAFAITGIGISTAGVVAAETGEIIYAGPTIPNYAGTNLKNLLEETFKVPTLVENDVNAAALGEAWLGAGQQTATFFCLTLGTGIGGAVVLDDKLHHGVHSRGGEIGYMNKQSREDLPFEQKASTSALLAKAAARLQVAETEVDGRDIFAKARAGETVYEQLIDEWTDDIARGIAPVICVLDPGLIIIGGGVSQQGDYLLHKIREHLYTYIPTAFVDTLTLKTATCGNKAGMLGAIYPMLP